MGSTGGLESISPATSWRENRESWVIQPMARLRPGVTVDQARGYLAGIATVVLEDAMDPKLGRPDAKYFLAMKFDPHPAASGFAVGGGVIPRLRYGFCWRPWARYF